MSLRKQSPRLGEILVPTDFSSGSARAMKFAVALAGRGRRVTAAHSCRSTPIQVWDAGIEASEKTASVGQCARVPGSLAAGGELLGLRQHCH